MGKIVGIYKITNPNNRVYIGQSNNIKYRFSQYKNINSTKGQPRLYNSFKKHGVNNHRFEIIELCNEEELNERERFWQEYYDVMSCNGMNCCYVNTKYKKSKISDITRKKLSEANKGKTITIEHKKILSESKKGSKNHMFDISRKDHPSSKLVLNLDNGVYYDSAKDAAEASNIRYKNLSRYLNGTRINKTNFIYI